VSKQKLKTGYKNFSTGYFSEETSSSSQVLFVVGLPFFQGGGWWLMLALKFTLLSSAMVTVHPAQPHHFGRILKITLEQTL